MAQSDPTRDRRNEKLWALLPPKDESYDLDQLSEGETAALVEALGGRYGDTLAQGHVSLPLPSNAQFALLEHWYHTPPDDPDKWMWRDAPFSIVVFPFRFDPTPLRIYFQNQFDRFCLRLTREMEQVWVERVRKNPTLPPLDQLDHSEDRRHCEDKARAMLYQKPC
jgi:hypothetical protein